MKTKISVIGGSGFLGSYVVQKFLETNHQVKVSTRDKGQPEHYQHLLQMHEGDALEICEINVLDMNSVAEFIKDSEVVVHCGTPFRFDISHEAAEELMYRPTLEGTKNIVSACQESESVKKLIIISSVAAINGFVPSFDPAKGREHIFTIKDEPVTHPEHPPYNQAKYRTDQWLRNFIQEHPALHFEIISLYPGLIIGKPMSELRDSTSAGMLYLLKNKLAPNPMMEMVYQYDIDFAMVAVEDVAEAIYQSAILPNLHGKKYFISHETWCASDIHAMLNGNNPEGAFRIQYNSQPAIDELGIHFSPAHLALKKYSELMV
ncbi:NAD-dependent epimerase/dehydratase family protein [Catalinimonas sp. 4WD22]|uniref:NAD-dependent epimerase/dehydratase family protein n=1 Tax=Catalinimonas locisalis TaxID=3133978 RepID=UPI0031013614